MLPDSDEVNLSPTELQILSELDRSATIQADFILICFFFSENKNFIVLFNFVSRQFGFLRLNSLEHRKKKAVVVKVDLLVFPR